MDQYLLLDFYLDGYQVTNGDKLTGEVFIIIYVVTRIFFP